MLRGKEFIFDINGSREILTNTEKVVIVSPLIMFGEKEKSISEIGTSVSPIFIPSFA